MEDFTFLTLFFLRMLEFRQFYPEIGLNLENFTQISSKLCLNLERNTRLLGI